MKNIYDVIIIGLGPAGVSSALYTHRAGADTLVIGQDVSALMKSEKIDNYYGVPKGTTGEELFNMGISQLKQSNVETLFAQVTGIEWDGDFNVKTSSDNFVAKSVILATGTSRKAPAIKGLKEFEGRGVSYCAVCDGFFYRGKVVAVLGEGEYAAEEASYLKNLAEKVYVLSNGKSFEKQIDGVEYINNRIDEIKGDTTVNQIIFEDGESIDVSGLFVAVGVAGATDFARKLGVAVDGNAIAVDEHCATNIPGLYAAGDNTKGMYQVAKAVYQGAVAGGESAKYVRKIKEQK